MKAIWTIDIDPPCSAEEAALEAFMIMQRRGTSANCFTIVGDDGHKIDVDLEAVWQHPKALGRAQQRARQETQHYLIAQGPSGVSLLVCGPERTREDVEATLAPLRAGGVSGRTYFRLEIDPFVVRVLPTSAMERPS